MINFNNPLSPISAFPICVGVGPFHWSMTNLPYPPRKQIPLTLQPSAKISSAKVEPPMSLHHPAGMLTGLACSILQEIVLETWLGLHGTRDTTDADRHTYRTAGSRWAAH